MQEEDKKSGVIKWVVVGVVILLLLALAVFLLLRFAKDSPLAVTIGGVLPFGELAPEIPGGNSSGTTDNTNTDPDTTFAPDAREPLFRQLTEEQIAGATTVLRDGKTFVRYVLRKNGNIFEVDTTTWTTRQLTITTIPQIHEAYFANSGNSVVLRYLKQDRATAGDAIKTYLGDIILPFDMASTSDAVGEIRGKYLQDNISAVSISADGTKLLYFIPNTDGVVGFVQNLNSLLDPKEVLRSSFGEWLPQLFNDGTILLATKPSANIPGFSYLYNPVDKSMTRIVREKNGLTVLGENTKKNVLFGENLNGNSVIGIYNQKGFVLDEGLVNHESPIPLTTLPEKCVWGQKSIQLYCGAFSKKDKVSVPDDWYQGFVSFEDLFWMVGADNQEIKLLGDPQKEVSRSFDTYMPFIDTEDKFLFFTDKNTDFLWSMRIVQPTTDEGESSLPPPTPEEAGDAAGSQTN